MAAKRIAQSSINWAAIAERVPPDQRAQYIAFKAKSDSYLRKVVSLPPTPPKIDWAYYKSKVPLPAMVEEFQKKYDSFSIPLPADNISSIIASQEKEAAAYVKKFKEESVARVAEYEAELKHLESQIPVSEMTMEEFAYAYPDLALDPTNRPTFWPHTPEFQPHPDDDKEESHAH